jgi:hypothetical protein
MIDDLVPAVPPEAAPGQDTGPKVSKSETGHAKNVANFHDLKTFCESYGPSYNPSNPLLTVAALDTKYTSSKASLKTVSELIPAWVNAVDYRFIAFAPFSALITRVYNSLASSGASKEFIADVLTIVRKLQGRRAKSIPDSSEMVNVPGNTSEEEHKYISASQQSMDKRIETFYTLIQLLISQPLYSPNETELQIASLTALYNNLSTLNETVVTTYAPLSNARFNRDKELYHPVTGLVKIALDTKKYIKSLFGASSAQYKQIAKIHFKGGTDLANKVK